MLRPSAQRGRQDLHRSSRSSLDRGGCSEFERSFVPEILTLVNARGGSKGVPRKNIVPIAGKPLIAWTLEAAQKAESVRRLIVSTDDPEIAEVARRWGAEVPVLRPPELAQDDTPQVHVVLHILEYLETSHGYRPDYVLLLQPTSPLRSPEDIDGAVELALRCDAESVVSVCEARSHPYWCRRLTPDGKLLPFVEAALWSVSRQQLPKAYQFNGAIFLVRRESVVEKRAFVTGDSLAYVMPRERSLDIDDTWDLHVARLIMENLVEDGSD